MSDVERLAAACLLPGFAGLEPPDELLRWIDRGLGGVVLFKRNIRDAEQLTELTSRLRAARADLVVATDEEGGDVTRLEATTGSSFPGNLALGVVDDLAPTREVAAAIASQLARVGVTMNLAPVADVNTNPRNPVIGVRSFGSDPELVSRHVAAFVEGTQSRGVAACAKHFPGHGDTSADSHLELPVSGGPLEPHLAPFRAAVAARVEVVMTAHVVVPELGSEPATVSSAAMRLLRDDLGFTGLVMSDAVEMRAVAATMGSDEAAVRALAAGVDAICLGHDLAPEPVHAAIVEAVRSGRLGEDRLAQSAAAVARTARWPATGLAEDERGVGAAAARRALRVVGEPRLRATPTVVDLVPPSNIAAGVSAFGLGEAVRERLPETEVVRVTHGAELGELDARPLVVVVRDAGRHAWQRKLAVELLAAHEDVVVVETGLPGWTPEGARAVVSTHGAGRANLEAAAEVLAGG
jgi:beta-N-acetylhexosaminidase